MITPMILVAATVIGYAAWAYRTYYASTFNSASSASYVFHNLFNIDAMLKRDAA